jgi:hypothetical protein
MNTPLSLVKKSAHLIDLWRRYSIFSTIKRPLTHPCSIDIYILLILLFFFLLFLSFVPNEVMLFLKTNDNALLIDLNESIWGSWRFVSLWPLYKRFNMTLLLHAAYTVKKRRWINGEGLYYRSYILKAENIFEDSSFERCKNVVMLI